MPARDREIPPERNWPDFCRIQEKRETMEMLPKEFREKMERLLGREAEEFFASYEKERKFGLRLNRRKTDGRLPETLSGLEPIPWAADGYFYPPEERPGKHPFHEAGLYYIQEPSAMAPAEVLAPAAGERILDLCAAPGGKTTQAAGKMGGTGLFVSNEIHPARAKILSQNVERMGLSNTVVLNEPPDRLVPVFPEFFDGILVDAPCSGEGMFRKNEEASNEWGMAQVELCAGRQDEILDCAAAMLKPGGRMVYSTCTFSPEENEGSVSRFLSRHPEFSLLRPALAETFSEGRPEWADGNAALSDTVRIWPHKTEGEGHFLALLIKHGEPKRQESVEKNRAKGRKRAEKEIPGKKEWQEFCEAALSEAGRETMKKEEAGKQFLAFGDGLYLIPEDMVPLKGLRVLRPGLCLGTVKKGRLEPSHGLALFLKSCDAASVFDVGTGETAARYLRGEALKCPDSEKKGWTLITSDGYSLGWAKGSGGTLKNHYPKGLRQP